MKKFLLLVVLSFICTIVQAKEDNYSLYIMTLSHHYVNNDIYNNKNWGFYVKHRKWGVGAYKNSYGDNTVVIARSVATIYNSQYVHISLEGGAAFGYKRTPIMPGILLSVDVGRLTLNVTPVVTNISFKLLEF